MQVTVSIICTLVALIGTTLGDIDRQVNVFYKLEIDLWNQLNGESFKENGDVKLIKIYKSFIDNLTKEYPNGLEYRNMNNIWERQIYDNLQTIYAMFESFKRFANEQVKNKVPYPKEAWIDFTETIKSYDIMNIIPRLHNLLKKQSFYYRALQKIDGDLLCSLKESPQQILLNLYNTIALTELKAYTMIQFSYMLLRLYNKGNFSKEADLAKTIYEENRRESLEMMLDAAKKSSRELWICDPKTHKAGVTYLEITELLQGYITNEVDINPDGGCWENCAAYENTKSYGCYKNLYCKEQRRCYGTIHNCTFVDSDSYICPARKGTHRRYEYIRYENGKTYGRNMGCSKGTVQVDSWWRYLFWHCSYCTCLCDEAGINSDRYINMMPAVSDIENNMVVTGLKFTKHNRIIHLQVEQGKLLNEENIDQSSLQWVPVDDYSLTDKKYKNGVNYTMLTWMQRAIDLDDIHKHSNRSEIVTGVRFRKIGYHLNLEVRFTQYNVTSGKLFPRHSEWIGNLNTENSKTNPRKQLVMEKLDVPIKSPSPSLPDSNDNQYLMFTNSDWERDVAQTTLPFFDAQPVSPRQAVPLGGVGIYHKGRKGFGGFVAPKIFTLDIVDKLLRSAKYNDI